MSKQENERFVPSHDEPQVIVSFSGGKDSTWMLLEMMRRKERIDKVVFFDTGWEFPQTIKHVEKIKNLVEKEGIEFVTLHPRESFDYFMFEKPRKSGKVCGWSWCGYAGGRWGTREKRLTFNRYFGKIGKYVQCIGIAADETERIQKERAENIRMPLVEYGITEEECLQGCYEAGYDWDGIYNELDRLSCRFCAFKNIKELRNIYWKMPDVWQELKDHQAKTPYPLKGEAGSVFDLEKRFEMEKKFLDEGKSITSRDFYKKLKEMREQNDL